MAEEPLNTEVLPRARVERRRHASVPLVWLIPLLAACIGAWLAVNALLERGPTITIRFSTADGLEPAKTRVKYKNVDIGELKHVALSNDRSEVIATVELARNTETLLVEDSRFWIVRPQISAGQVSGLGTLLSGSYIGVDAGKSDKRRLEFRGLDVAPIVTLDLPGRHFDLRAQDLGSLDVGSPVYLRRIQVGQVVAFELEPDGRNVKLKVFVRAPYDAQVGTGTRFWHASGLDFALGADGVQIKTESLVALLLGGISFETPPTAGSPAPKGQLYYTLFASREQALRHPDTSEKTYVMLFSDSVRGLSPGAPVDFRGVIVGEVSTIQLDTDPASKEITVPVEIRLYPERLLTRYRKPISTDAPNHETLMQHLVARGLRAQLRAGNLLTGQLYVALDYFPNASSAKLDLSQKPVVFPTMPGSMQDLQETLTSVAKKLERFPFDELAGDLRGSLASFDTTLRTLDRTIGSAERLVKRIDADITPEARAALKELRSTLGAAKRALVTADSTLSVARETLSTDAPMQHDLREALREVARAARAIRTLADYLERRPDALLRGRTAEEK